MELIITPAKWSDYERFKPYCCVETTPAIAGPCWTANIPADNGEEFEAADVGFIGYSYPFRNNSVRAKAIPEIKRWGRRGQIAYINREIRCLTRVMVRPTYRGQGIATELIQKTVSMVGVKYIECLTFTESIAKILEACGYVNYGKTGGMKCDYYLLEKTA